MRLTNALRETFIDKVMLNVPMKSKVTQTTLIEEIESRIKARYPQDVKDFIKQHPQSVNFSSQRLSWLDERRFDGVLTRTCHAYVNYVVGFGLKDESLPPVAIDDLIADWEVCKTELDERKTLRARVSEVTYSATTTDALALLFPDLASLIPQKTIETKRLPVAASGLIQDLKASGLTLGGVTEASSCK